MLYTEGQPNYPGQGFITFYAFYVSAPGEATKDTNYRQVAACAIKNCTGLHVHLEILVYDLN